LAKFHCLARADGVARSLRSLSMNNDALAALSTVTGGAMAGGALTGGVLTGQRLYHLEGEGPLAGLLAEAWALQEGLNEPWRLELSALSGRPDLDLDDMLGRRLTLRCTLADGDFVRHSGIVTSASAEESDGGFARYRLVVECWLGLLAHSRRSQVWQEKTLVEIVESVFERYAGQAAWRWTDEVAGHLAASPFCSEPGVRSYTAQYREADLDFVQRLLAEEGLVYRFEADEGAPLGHALVILADTARDAACPEDDCSASALGGAGIRFHAEGVLEEQDTLQAFGGERRLPVARASATAWDYAAKRVRAASLPTPAAFGGAQAPRLEAYDHFGAYAFAGDAQAERALELVLQAHEAHHKTWFGRGTVRSFGPGRWFTLSASLLDLQPQLADTGKQFLLSRVVHAGINNLPKDGNQAIVTARMQGGADLLPDWVGEALKRQAADSGYANRFEALRRMVRWLPLLADETGQRLNPRPTITGQLCATVVGPAGEEIHMDARGRIRIRFDFQEHDGQAGGTSAASTWVRVLQRHAEAGMGLQFIPRIGQQVLVAFVEGDIDRPLVVGALHDGQGEGGVPPTPGGREAGADASVFARSHDHRPAAQGNLVGGGHAPAWHGWSAADATPGGGQRNAGALSGWKTQEFSGTGFNQLVFDDSDAQLRTQWASSQHASQLSLGHLIHQADNHRGSFRGLGFELRTDAYGALRAGHGLLVSSYGTQAAEPAGDAAAAIALSRQLCDLGEVLSDAARRHQTVALACHIGSLAAGQCMLSDQAAGLQALRTSLSGMVTAAAFDRAEADARDRRTTAADGTLPHLADPALVIAARAGLGLTAGTDLQLSSGDTLTTAAGQDSDWAIGGDLRLHTAQAIGLLGGAIAPGNEAVGHGVTLIAARQALQVQAQSDRLEVAAQQDIRVESVNGFLEIASPKKLSLSVAGGANITLEGGNITLQCPGTITVLAGHKSFQGPARVP
jgi:type VI secretion system VgrG family protein